MDAIELWRDSIPEDSRVEVGAGAALLGIGAVAAFTRIGRRRSFIGWLLPAAFLSAGVVVLARALLGVRSDRIADTQASIEAELASLDPIARAYVLKNVSQNELRRVVPGLN